jgi:hypothetical protein
MSRNPAGATYASPDLNREPLNGFALTDHAGLSPWIQRRLWSAHFDQGRPSARAAHLGPIFLEGGLGALAPT